MYSLARKGLFELMKERKKPRSKKATGKGKRDISGSMTKNSGIRGKMFDGFRKSGGNLRKIKGIGEIAKG